MSVIPEESGRESAELPDITAADQAIQAMRDDERILIDTAALRSISAHRPSVSRLRNAWIESTPTPRSRTRIRTALRRRPLGAVAAVCVYHAFVPTAPMASCTCSGVASSSLANFSIAARSSAFTV